MALRLGERRETEVEWKRNGTGSSGKKWTRSPWAGGRTRNTHLSLQRDSGWRGMFSFRRLRQAQLEEQDSYQDEFKASARKMRSRKALLGGALSQTNCPRDETGALGP